MHRWNSSAPIYQQLADCIAALILEGNKEGETPLPSVRQLASAYAVNPLTVTRALDYLRKRGWIEVRHGIGSFACSDAKARIAAFGREQFMQVEWPVLRAKLDRLGLDRHNLDE